MRPLCSTLDSEVVNVPLVNATNISLIRQSLLFDLFNVGAITIELATFLPIHLLISPMLSLIEKKLISLGKKYFSIPFEHLPYYPEIPSAFHTQIDNEHEQAP
jgi:hypothetical protein